MWRPRLRRTACSFVFSPPSATLLQTVMLTSGDFSSVSGAAEQLWHPA
jgi:hypothetical protein